MNPVSFSFAFNNKAFANRLLKLKIIHRDRGLASPLHGLSFQEEGRKQELGMNEDERGLGGAEFGRSRTFEEMRNSCARDEDGVTMHVNEVLLAAHSEYFMKLFTNGMKETKSDSTIEIEISSEEEESMMELLYFVHTGKLHSRRLSNIVKLLFMADRFRVPSCFQPCVQALNCLPKFLSDCLLLLALPESMKTNHLFSSLMDFCGTYIGNYFQNLVQKKSQFLALPIYAVSPVLAFDELNVKTEEEVFTAVLEWTETNCATLEDQILAMEELSPVIRFPWMEGNFLVDVVLPDPRMQGKMARELVMEALSFKCLSHWRKQELICSSSNNKRYKARNSQIQSHLSDGGPKTHVVKTLEPGHCTVYFDFPLGAMMCGKETPRSKHFSPDGIHGFYLEALQAPSFPGFGERHTGYIRIVHAHCPFVFSSPSPPSLVPHSTDDPDSGERKGKILEYKISRKIKPLEEYEKHANGSIHLNPSVFGPIATINSLFDPWWGMQNSLVASNRFPPWDASFMETVYIRAKFEIK